MDVAAALHHLFPLVDSRIIKATAFEHGEDIEAAIKFIEDEVLPELEDEVGGPDDRVTDDEGVAEDRVTDDEGGAEDRVTDDEGGAEDRVTDDEGEAEESSDSLEDYEFEEETLAFDKVDDQPVPDEPVWTGASSYVVDIEMIDQDVEQIKADKQALLDAKEEVEELRRQADEAEAVAREAKNRGEVSVDQLFSKAAETRETRVRAKQANERRSGDIYGEKAILGTEAKELHARLQQLRAEWRKAYDGVLESKIMLQKRVEAAKLEAFTAEQESIRKEEDARKALLEEENALAQVVNESNALDAEAEACTKLQIFLFERGSIVDSLQGEIAVLNEDVEFLKKKIDGLALSDVYESFQMKVASQHSTTSISSKAFSSVSPVGDSAHKFGDYESEVESNEEWHIL